MRVVDGQQQRLGDREVGRQPVQAVKQGKMSPAAPGSRGGVVVGEQRAGQRRGARESLLTLVGGQVTERRLEQLAHDAEGEVALELRAASGESG